MKIIATVQEAIQSCKDILPGGKVIVAVSGGPDSVGLLHILSLLQHELGICLHVAHINHHLRKSASTDEKFVNKMTNEMNLPFSKISLDPQKMTGKGSLEENARQYRFAALIKIAKQKKAQAVFLGHTQDDLAETVLMRVIRGTGLLGMQAMIPVRKIQGINFIRPLLSVQKHDITQFLKRNQIQYREDSSNQNKKFFRNQIRLELLQILEKRYNPHIRQVLANLAKTTTADYDYLRSAALERLQKIRDKKTTKNRIVIHCKPFTALHPALQRMILRLAIENLKGETRRLTLKHIEQIEYLLGNRVTKFTVSLPGRVLIKKDDDFLMITVRKA